MTLEVEALKARILETQSDGAELRAKFERRDSILERQAEEERHLESEEGRRASEGREAEIEEGIAQLQRVPITVSFCRFPDCEVKYNISGSREGEEGKGSGRGGIEVSKGAVAGSQWEVPAAVGVERRLRHRQTPDGLRLTEEAARRGQRFGGGRGETSSSDRERLQNPRKESEAAFGARNVAKERDAENGCGDTRGY